MKTTVSEVGKLLIKNKISCGMLHGDLEQVDRDKMTTLFRNGSLRVLVATDVAARGLDIDTLELVINMDMPSSTEIYVHRIGRTGRAGRKGTAVSIFTDYEVPKIAEIEQATGVQMIRKSLNLSRELDFPEVIKTSPYRNLQISGGKSHKLRPGDILGALTSQPAAISGQDVGKIEVKDRWSYVAVKSPMAKKSPGKTPRHKDQRLKI